MRIIIPFFILLLISCKEKKNNTKQHNASNQNETNRFVPSVVDSVDILYFNKPFTDAERYQRFFRIVHVGDTAVINSLRTAFQNTVTEDLLNPKKCKSEGKIIVPTGGDAFKIIYFSRLETKCAYLYVIENGHFLYYQMDSSLNRLLNSLEFEAVEP